MFSGLEASRVASLVMQIRSSTADSKHCIGRSSRVEMRLAHYLSVAYRPGALPDIMRVSEHPQTASLGRKALKDQGPSRRDEPYSPSNKNRSKWIFATRSPWPTCKTGTGNSPRLKDAGAGLREVPHAFARRTVEEQRREESRQRLWRGGRGNLVLVPVVG